MDGQQWSRSRFWLCHFLNHRHVRLPIAWDTPRVEADQSDLQLVIDWLARFHADRQAPAGWMLRDAATRYADDPAYVQDLRLFQRERQHHARVAADLLERLGGTADLVTPFHRRATRVFGPRFELSILLLHGLISTQIEQIVADAGFDPVVTQACRTMRHDQDFHLAFISERLTKEFAAFNFVRRNLRRHRLRLMFGAILADCFGHHRDLLHACGWSRRRFAKACWKRFDTMLERMVPYKRDALLSALLAQDERPYAQAHSVISDATRVLGR